MLLKVSYSEFSLLIQTKIIYISAGLHRSYLFFVSVYFRKCVGDFLTYEQALIWLIK